MTREEFKKVVALLLPEAELESPFLSPFRSFTISADLVFDVLRQATEPPVSKEEFNQIADEFDHLRRGALAGGCDSVQQARTKAWIHWQKRLVSPALQAGGRGFESLTAHQFSTTYGP
jgi:hypothetical protein